MQTLKKVVFWLGIVALLTMPYCLWKLSLYQEAHGNIVRGTPENIAGYVAFLHAYDVGNTTPASKRKMYLHALVDQQCAILMSIDKNGMPNPRNRIHEECDQLMDDILIQAQKRETDFCKTQTGKPECSPDRLETLFADMRKSYHKSRDKFLDTYLAQFN